MEVRGLCLDSLGAAESGWGGHVSLPALPCGDRALGTGDKAPLSESHRGCSLSLRMFVLKRKLPQMFWAHKHKEGTSALKTQR